MHAADGGKDVARRAAELCGGALNITQRPANHNGLRTQGFVYSSLLNNLIFQKKEPSEKRFRKLPQDPVFYEIMAHTAVMSSLLSPARRAAALISASARAWGGASFWESITCSISSSVSTSDTPSEVM